MDFQRKVTEFIEQNNMIGLGDEVILGLSGGADSVALFFVLMEFKKIFLQQNKTDLPVQCVYVHHMIRDDADKDVELVTKLCRDHGVPLAVEKCDVTALAKANSQTVEEAGRKIRYEIFAGYAKKAQENGYTAKIAVAHHMDDQAETVLFNLVRGTGISGLSGMRPVSGNIIRPLLCVTKAQILDYMNAVKAEFITDSTNSDIAYSRNRLRNETIPSLENINERAVEHIAAASAKLSVIEDFLMNSMMREYAKCVEKTQYRGVDEYHLSVDLFVGIDPALKSLLVWKMLAECAGSAKDIGEIHVKNVEALTPPGSLRASNLPYGMFAYRTADEIVLRKQEQADEQANTADMGFEQTFTMDVMDIGDVADISVGENGEVKVTKKECTKFFDYDKINGCVHMRKPDPSDAMVIDSQGHRKRVGRIFIDMKIPLYKRDDYSVICDDENILWIPGVRDAYVCRVDEHTKRVAVISVPQDQ